MSRSLSNARFLLWKRKEIQVERPNSQIEPNHMLQEFELYYDYYCFKNGNKINLDLACNSGWWCSVAGLVQKNSDLLTVLTVTGQFGQTSTASDLTQERTRAEAPAVGKEFGRRSLGGLRVTLKQPRRRETCWWIKLPRWIWKKHYLVY